VFGYGGKQVRDNLHSSDVVAAFTAFHADPRPGAVYNLGGGRVSNCSVLEAIAIAERITGRPLDRAYDPRPRKGDHRWWISDLAELQRDYPTFAPRYGVEDLLREIYEVKAERWLAPSRG
jgi:CDP-paratose 2-epimerase